jgi:hypothetical protein
VNKIGRFTRLTAAQRFIREELKVMERSYEPANPEEQAEIDEARLILKGITEVIEEDRTNG